jgi:hypothetical protein
MKVISSGVAAGIAAAALVSLTPAAHAAASQTVMIRPGDFVSQLSDTRSAGHVDFLEDGLHVWTDDATSNAKAAEYVAVPAQGIPSTASLTWYGTSPQPGSQIVFDVDSDRTNANTWNILVGEPTYADDYWYPGGTTRAAAHGVTCPQTTGGSGSDCHGTLAEWQQAVPTAEVYAVGFSLGSGIKGDGVLEDLQVGDTDYRFTTEPATTTVDVTGTATVTRVDRTHRTNLKAAFVTDDLGANQVQGTKLTFEMVVDGDTVFHDRMGAGEDSFTKVSFEEHTGRHVVQILKNGEVDQTLVVKMGK